MIKVPVCCPQCGGRKLEVEIVVWGVWFDGVFDCSINKDAGYDVETLNRPALYCEECNYEATLEPEVRRHG